MPIVAAGVSIDNGTVIVLITLIVLPIAAIAFASSGAAWRQIGKGPFAIETETPAPGPRSAPPADDRAAVAAEARQMLEAKSYRQVRRGQPPLDIEAELRDVLAGEAPNDADPELRDEVRRLVVVRSERRVREGHEPLDIEAETERQLEDLIGSRD